MGEDDETSGSSENSEHKTYKTPHFEPAFHQGSPQHQPPHHQGLRQCCEEFPKPRVGEGTWHPHSLHSRLLESGPALIEYIPFTPIHPIHIF